MTGRKAGDRVERQTFDTTQEYSHPSDAGATMAAPIEPLGAELVAAMLTLPRQGTAAVC
jgi:hypothetical protein